MGRASQQEVGDNSKQRQISRRVSLMQLHVVQAAGRGVARPGLAVSNLPGPLLLCRWPARKKWSLESLRKAFAGHDVIAGAATGRRPQVAHASRLAVGSLHVSVAGVDSPCCLQLFSGKVMPPDKSATKAAAAVCRQLRDVI